MTMKKFYVIVVLILIFVFGVANRYCNTYTMGGVVTSIKDDIAVVEDDTHNVWQVYDTTLKKGDRVRIKWFNNTTDMTREDDEIINIKVVK